MQPAAPRKGWFGRNWKWFVPSGCMTIIVLIAVFVGGILAVVEGSVKRSDAYIQALARVQADPQVSDKIGRPIEPGWFISGSVNVNGDSGDANLSIPISGPKGKGKIYVEAKKSAGLWQFETLQVEVEGQPGRIDLLQEPQAAQPAPVAMAQPATPAPAPGAAGSSTEPAPGTAAPSVAPTAPATGMAAALASGDTNITGIVAEVTECARKEGVLSLKLRLRNTNPAAKNVDIISGRNYESFYLSAGNKKYFVLKDTDGTYLMPRTDGFGGLSANIDPGGQYAWWAKFPAPPDDVKSVTLYTPLGAPIESIPISSQ
jgi:hypothetical protein